MRTVTRCEDGFFQTSALRKNRAAHRDGASGLLAQRVPTCGFGRPRDSQEIRAGMTTPCRGGDKNDRNFLARWSTEKQS